MGSMPLSPPPSAAQSPEFGPGPAQPGPMNISPAPPSPPDQGAMQIALLIRNILTDSRTIADLYPSTVPMIQQMNDLLQQIQMKVVQSSPPSEVAAPPV